MGLTKGPITLRKTASKYPGYNHTSWLAEFSWPRIHRYLTASFHVLHKKVWGVQVRVELHPYFNVKKYLRSLGIDPTPEVMADWRKASDARLAKYASEMEELRVGEDPDIEEKIFRLESTLNAIWREVRAK